MLPAFSPEAFSKVTSAALTSSGKFAGEGIHRTGTVVGDICIKSASQWGVEANREEVNAWALLAETTNGDADLFAPVLAHASDFSWLAMPRCEPVAWETSAKAKAWCRANDVDPDEVLVSYGQYTAHLDYLEWLDSDAARRASAITSDLHCFNVMRAPDGRVVVTDYGMGCEGIGGDSLADNVYREDGDEASDGWVPSCGCPECRGGAFDDGDDCQLRWGALNPKHCPSCGWNVGEVAAELAEGLSAHLVPACDCHGCMRHQYRGDLLPG